MPLLSGILKVSSFFYASGSNGGKNAIFLNLSISDDVTGSALSGDQLCQISSSVIFYTSAFATESVLADCNYSRDDVLWFRNSVKGFKETGPKQA